jgi:putative two-component system response regulator
MKKTVLVVDDLPDQIFTVKASLEQGDDFEVIGVESGEQCLDYLNRGMLPDVILMESRMQGMSGWEILTHIRQNPLWENIPVAFLTAWTDTKQSLPNNVTVDDIIEKPFDMRDLKERINSMLQKH